MDLSCDDLARERPESGQHRRPDASGEGQLPPDAVVGLDGRHWRTILHKSCDDPVFDKTGAHLGRVHHLMIDKYPGQVVLAVASFGGLFGICERLFPLPWQALDYDASRGGYVVDIDRAGLESAPCFEAERASDWSDRAFTDEITKYWLPPV